MSWLDVMIILIFGFSVLSGFSRGLILTLTSLISFFFSVIVANLFYKELANTIISNTGLEEQIGTLIQSISEKGNIIETSTGINGNIVNLPEGAKGLLQALLSNINSNADSGFSHILTSILIHIISFFMIFIVIRFILYIVSNGLNTLSKLPILNVINKMGGAFIGIVQGMIYSMIIVSIFYTIAIFGLHNGLANTIDNSTFAQFFYIGYLFY